MDTGTFAQNQGMSSATTPCVGPGCGSSAPDVSSFTNYRANPNLPTLEEIASYNAVSYTHLDVYKRQLMNRLFRNEGDILGVQSPFIYRFMRRMVSRL